jgi:hypothetical protein
MHRLKAYFNAFVWQAGLGYLALWAITIWSLDQGPAVFGASGVCQPDQAKVLFYWVCDPTSPFGILAALANFALTTTVWAPVYVAAATVKPDAMAIAVSIVLLHVVGLPTAIFVVVRLAARFFDVARLMLGRVRPEELAGAAPPKSAASIPLAPPPKPTRIVKPRDHFGLRGGGSH